MNTITIIEQKIADNQHLLQNLYKLVYQSRLHDTQQSTSEFVSVPLILPVESPAMVIQGKVVRAYQPEVNGIVFECLGHNEIKLSSIANHPMNCIFAQSIEQAAKCLVEEKYRFTEGEAFFTPTVVNYVGRIATLTHLFHSAQWMIDDVYRFRASEQPNDIMHNDSHETFKKNLALWFVARVVRHHEELRSLLLERKYASDDSRRIFETIDKGEAQTLEAFRNCANWKSSSLELLMELCHANCADEESVFRRNPHRFWWEMSIQLFDNKLSKYGKREVRRVINQHFTALRNKLPFAFLRGQFFLQN